MRRTGIKILITAIGLVAVALSLTVVAVSNDESPAEAAPCSLASTGGVVSRTIGARSYLLKVPSGLTGEVPLLVAHHGLNSDPEGVVNYAPWETLADSRGYVVAYPRGNNGTWDIHQNSSDVAFVRSVIADIESTYCIDSARVHVTGDSMGGYMAQRLACDAADVVASAGEYAAGSPELFGSGPCTPSRPISVTMFHGTDDRLVRIALGRASRDQWAVRDACGAPATQNLSDGKVLSYSCASGTKLQWREYNGAGHLSTWPQKGGDMSTRQLDFFAANPHPTR